VPEYRNLSQKVIQTIHHALERVNTYRTVCFRRGMVKIECPHCEGIIELDDGAFGMFECPLCEGEFEFGDEPLPRYELQQQPIASNAEPRLLDTIIKVLASFSLGVGAVFMLLVVGLLIMIIISIAPFLIAFFEFFAS